MTEIHGRAAIVTGGGSGIGEALGKELAKQGASIAVVDIILTNAKRLARKIEEGGGQAVAPACDVSSRAEVRRIRDEATLALGPITLVFANAGVTSFDPLCRLPTCSIDSVPVSDPARFTTRVGHLLEAASRQEMLT